MTDREELRRLAQAATPGPWRVQHPFDGERGWEVAERTGLEQICAGLTSTRAAFIAAANPAVVLELLDEIERLRTQRDEHKADWLEALALAEQASPILARQQAEIERLRAVFEAVRAVLRYGGPDKFGKAWCELDKAVKAALLADQGGYLV